MDLLYLKPYEWTDGEADNHYEVRIWGHNRENKPCLWRCLFEPSIVIKLPEIYEWNASQGKKVMERINSVLNMNGQEHGAIKYEFSPLSPLYGAYTKKHACIRAWFRNLEALKHCMNYIKKPLQLWKGQTPLQLTVFEDGVTTITKFITEKNIEYASWISANGTRILKKNDKRITTPTFKGNEYIIYPSSVALVPLDLCKDWIVRLSLLSTDCECNSENINAMPKSSNDDDVCFMIGAMYRDHKGIYTRYCLTCCEEVPDVPGTIVQRYETEIEMYLGYAQLVIDLDPDAIIGHNIMGFDWPYMDDRLTSRLYTWPDNMSRIAKYKPYLATAQWESSAYAHMSMYWLNLSGRITADLLIISKRQFRLDSYRLDELGKKFLGKGKLTGIIEKNKASGKAATKKATVLTRTSQKEGARSEELLKNETNVMINKPVLDKNKRRLEEEEGLAVNEEVENPSLLLRDRDLLEEDQEPDENEDDDIQEGYLEHQDIFTSFRTRNPSLLQKVAVYCCGAQEEGQKPEEGDCGIVIQLWDVLGIEVGLISLANVAKVSPCMIFIRGMQVRAYNQLYREATKRGIYMMTEPLADMIYSGAHVFDPKTGLYQGIITLDFSGLYPSIIIAHNICYTTYRAPDDPIADELCHVIEVDEKDDEGKDVHYKIRFAKEPIGVLPANLIAVIAARARVKTELKKGEEVLGKNRKQALEKEEDACKLTANSAYGSLGTKQGKLCFRQGAVAVTAIARKSINMVAKHLEDNYDAEIIYGDTDSVMVNILSLLNTITLLLTKEDKEELDSLREELERYREVVLEVNTIFNSENTDMDNIEELKDIRIMSKLSIRSKKAYQRLKDKDARLKELEKLETQDIHSIGKLYTEKGIEMAREVTKLFKAPMSLAFEKVYYKYLLLKKKQYAGFIYACKEIKDPLTKEVMDKRYTIEISKKAMKSKGIMVVRRDNPLYVRSMYESVVYNGLIGKKKEYVRALIEEKTLTLYYHGVKEKDLIVIQKIGKDYKKATNPLKVYSEHLIRSGKVVEPGDRIPFVYRVVAGAKTGGAKMQHPELRRKNKDKLDYNHYVEKKAMPAIDKLYKTIYSVKERPIRDLRIYIKWHEKLLREFKSEWNYMLQLKGLV